MIQQCHLCKRILVPKLHKVTIELDGVKKEIYLCNDCINILLKDVLLIPKVRLSISKGKTPDSKIAVFFVKKSVKYLPEWALKKNIERYIILLKP